MEWVPFKRGKTTHQRRRYTWIANEEAAVWRAGDPHKCRRILSIHPAASARNRRSDGGEVTGYPEISRPGYARWGTGRASSRHEVEIQLLAWSRQPMHKEVEVEHLEICGRGGQRKWEVLLITQVWGTLGARLFQLSIGASKALLKATRMVSTERKSVNVKERQENLTAQEITDT
ncbi:hypothetical protein VTK73DRAFT_89 [Phialemonium thermophilum]|uniref:Uncharacterized protein n=1 Tax=Phialemonium thermophilum TaxID=223376 RepID=A0ABR3Y422_9PEZI